LVLSHGDFHAGQLLVGEGSPAAIDFDRACAAPPALDLATYCAHLVDGHDGDRDPLDALEPLLEFVQPCDERGFHSMTLLCRYSVSAMPNNSKVAMPVKCESSSMEFTFALELRVRFAETDAQGVVHNASYLVWFELARVEYLRAFAGGYQALRDRGIEAFVLESHVRYLEPARFDDLLVVRTRCDGVRGARFRFDYAIERDGVRIADGWTSHACVDSRTLRPTRIPAWLADAIATAEAGSAAGAARASSAPSSPAP
jgi:acyl-CoA thioester hydrolase